MPRQDELEALASRAFQHRALTLGNVLTCIRSKRLYSSAGCSSLLEYVACKRRLYHIGRRQSERLIRAHCVSPQLTPPTFGAPNLRASGSLPVEQSFCAEAAINRGTGLLYRAKPLCPFAGQGSGWTGRGSCLVYMESGCGA